MIIIIIITIIIIIITFIDKQVHKAQCQSQRLISRRSESYNVLLSNYARVLKLNQKYVSCNDPRETRFCRGIQVEPWRTGLGTGWIPTANTLLPANRRILDKFDGVRFLFIVQVVGKVQKKVQFSFCGQRKAFHYGIVFRGILLYFLYG